jgi:hypothetical protein
MNANAATNEALFDQVCDLLQMRRRKRSHHTPLDTLNRLFVKCLVGQSIFGVDRPWLTSSNTIVTRETRSKLEFAKLGHSIGDAHDCEHPIVIIRHRGVERMLHGPERCRASLASGDLSLHTAFVLVVRNS